MKKILLTLAMSSVLSISAANAAGGGGNINFNGSVVDSPCSIDPNSDGQEVVLGATSSTVLNSGGSSSLKSFIIKLEGCSGATLKTVTTTFSGDGASEDPKLLRVNGVSGAAIAFSDRNQNALDLNKPSTPYNLQNGNNELGFFASLKGFGTEEAPVTVGDYTAIANFTLQYQ